MITLEYLDQCRPKHCEDKFILGSALQDIDTGKDHTSDGTNYYSWYYALGAARQPESIAEMGVRFGYSLISICKGKIAETRYAPRSIMGWDMEYHPGSNAIAEANLRGHCRNVHIRRDFTGNIPTLNTVFAPYDLIHVDADHSYDGIKAELRLAFESVRRRGGWIVVDDTKSPTIASRLEDECWSHPCERLDVPTLRGMAIIELV